MCKALIAGCFDPVTVGHVDLIRRVAADYPHLTVGVFVNAEKTVLFTVEERLALLRLACRPFPNVTVDADSGYTYRYAVKNGITVLARGYRNQEDLAYEALVSEFNRTHGGLTTRLYQTDPAYATVSSSRVRDALEAGDTEVLAASVPPACLSLLLSFYRQHRDGAPANE